jgi:APA family basic amino acid/polyamine antiporter
VAAAGTLVALIVLVADVRGAIGFSAFTVLLYYAIANAAALTLRDAVGGRSAMTAAAGLAGCALLASSLPLASITGGCIVVALGYALYQFRSGRRT